MATYATRFGYCRRGRLPGGYTTRFGTTPLAERIEGALCDSAARNIFLVEPAGSATAAEIGWSIDAVGSPATIELLALIRVLTRGNAGAANFVGGLFVRGSGTSSATAYRALLGPGTDQLRLDKVVAGTATVLGTPAKSMTIGTYHWLRLGVTGTTVRAKTWPDGDTEPGAWDVSVTDSAISAGGWAGIRSGFRDESFEVAFLSADDAGSTAPGPSVLPVALSERVLDPHAEIEITAEIEYRDTATDLVGTAWASTHGRTTGPGDYPPDTVFYKLLSPGNAAARLDADVQFGGIEIRDAGALRLANLPVPPETDGPLDAWRGYSFKGRPVILRAGPPSSALHRDFEVLGSVRAAQEPVRGLAEVEMPCVPGPQVLERTLPVGRYVGIPTALESMTSTGWLSIPSHTSYNVASFVREVRAYIPAAGVAGSGQAILDRRGTGTSIQWQIALNQASATDAHKIEVKGYATDATVLFSATSTATYNLGAFVNIILGVDGARRWYAMVNGVTIGSGSITKNPATPTAVTELMRTAVGVMVCDARLEKYMTEDEALARYSAVLAPDALTLAMHRCDDSTGATITDYTATANHGTVGGTINVDFRWSPSYLGSAANAGTAMPICEGVVFHAPTVGIDSSREIFRFADRAKTTGTDLTVRAKYLALTAGASYTAEPVPGVVDIIGASDQPVTVGLSATAGTESGDIHVPRLVSNSLVARGVISTVTADIASFSALRKLWPMRGGYYYSEPPLTSDFLAAALSATGSYATADHSGRLAVSHLVEPANPGPYGMGTLLEFRGNANCGATLSPNSAYDLKQASTFGVALWVKFHRRPVDLATSGSFTHFPAGMTLVDHTLGAAGYYMGIDGRDGSLIWGAPGVTGTVSGKHYLPLLFPWTPGQWYFVWGYQDANTRMLSVQRPGDTYSTLLASETTTGTMTAGGCPTRIGHGPFGTFVGVLSDVIGSSHGVGEGGFWSGPEITVTRWSSAFSAYGQSRFYLPLDDGSGDSAAEVIQGRTARLRGVRWAPRLTLDLGASSDYSFNGLRSNVPAWRVRSKYKHNYQTLSGADVAGGVSAADRIAAGVEVLYEDDSSESIRADYPDALDVVVPSPDLPGILGNQMDADFIAYHLSRRMDPGKELAEVQAWRRDALALAVGDEVLLKMARFDLDAGRPYRVVAIDRKLDTLRVDLGLWGLGS